MIRRVLFLVLAVTVFCAPAFSQADSAGPDLRRPRAWAVSGEIGLNSLSSLVGPTASYYVKPQIAVDLGVGLSSGGLRPGLRTRYLFSRDKLAYFGGLGIKYALGSGGEDVEVEDPDTKAKFNIQVEAATFVDYMVGMEFLAHNGFLIIANAGYSQLVSGEPFTLSSGSVASDKAKKLYKAVLGSGIMLSVSLGKAF